MFACLPQPDVLCSVLSAVYSVLPACVWSPAVCMLVSENRGSTSHPSGTSKLLSVPGSGVHCLACTTAWTLASVSTPPLILPCVVFLYNVYLPVHASSTPLAAWTSWLTLLLQQTPLCHPFVPAGEASAWPSCCICHGVTSLSGTCSPSHLEWNVSSRGRWRWGHLTHQGTQSWPGHQRTLPSYS